MEYCSIESYLAPGADDGLQSPIEPTYEAISTFFVEDNLVVFQVVTQDRIWALSLPFEAAHTLVAALADDPELVSVVESYHYFRISVPQEGEWAELLH